MNRDDWYEYLMDWADDGGDDWYEYLTDYDHEINIDYSSDEINY